ncbi:MAG: hypothetical protein R6V60_02610 [Desulfobacterales bacterium]
MKVGFCSSGLFHYRRCVAKAKTSPAESTAEGSPASEIAAGTDMITPEFLPGTEMTTVETLPGTAIMITIKRLLFEPVMLGG